VEPPEDEGIDVVLTVGDLDAIVVTLREFLHRVGAVEVQAAVERPDGSAALVTCGRLAPIEVTQDGRTVHLPHAVELDAEPPELPSIPALPPLEVDGAAGVVTGPLGGVEAMARAVGALADVLGGRNVAWRSSRPPIRHAARRRGAHRRGADPHARRRAVHTALALRFICAQCARP
jgi:hypothetical protein